MKLDYLDAQAILYRINQETEAAYDRLPCAFARGYGLVLPGDRRPRRRPRPGPRPPVHELILREHVSMKKITRIGVGGPVGSGKTAIIEAITPKLIDLGIRILIITNDVVTTEDAKHVRRTLKGIMVEERILGVETGARPHTAVREDPSMNLAAVEDMEARFPDTDLVLIESGGDNLTLTFSPALVDYFLYVIDVAAGDKILARMAPASPSPTSWSSTKPTWPRTWGQAWR